MDPLLNAGGPRFCRWSSFGLPYSPTHAGKDDPNQHLRTVSWPEDQPKEDRSDAVERVQPYTSSSERRKPANNWRVHLPGKHSKAWWREGITSRTVSTRPDTIGHVMRREQDNITSTALHWTPEGKRKRWRPRNTWRRTVEAELKTMQHTWGTIQKLARNRQTWWSFVAVLRATRHNGNEWVWWVNGRTLDLKNSELV